MSNLCIVTATDEFYVDTTKVLLKSLSRNYSGEDQLVVFVMVPRDMTSYDFKLNLPNLDIRLAYPARIQKHEDSRVVAKMYKNTLFTGTSMYRFYIGDVTEGFDRAVYIDPDCVIARDISPVLEYDLQTPIAAFHEIQANYQENPAFADSAYFNSGVMIIDLNYWRINNIADELIELALRFTNWTGASDQDILNVVFRSKWSPLSINFNYLLNIYTKLDVPDPIIVHFAGKSKPWNSPVSGHKWRELWKYYHTTTF